MLCRLYEPILWRHLKVANGLVRANAASLMIDAFPLRNPTDSAQENDELLQKQFDLLDVSRLNLNQCLGMSRAYNSWSGCLLQKVTKESDKIAKYTLSSMIMIIVC